MNAISPPRAYANPSDLVSEVLVAVSALPEVMVWRANSGVGVTAAGNILRANTKGCPDILGVHRGRGIGIECKAGTGRLRKSQIDWRRAWERAGGLFIESRSPEQTVNALLLAESLRAESL